MKKEKDFPTLKGFPLGVGGVEHAFTLMYRRFGDEIIDKMSINTAKIQDFPTKGELKVGMDADVSIFKDDDSMVVNSNHGKCDYSIYEGLVSAGEFVHVLRRGVFVLKDRKLIESRGKLLNCEEN